MSLTEPCLLLMPPPPPHCTNNKTSTIVIAKFIGHLHMSSRVILKPLGPDFIKLFEATPMAIGIFLYRQGCINQLLQNVVVGEEGFFRSATVGSKSSTKPSKHIHRECENFMYILHHAPTFWELTLQMKRHLKSCILTENCMMLAPAMGLCILTILRVCIHHEKLCEKYMKLLQATDLCIITLPANTPALTDKMQHNLLCTHFSVHIDLQL